jgi:gas vesicle protein
MNKTLKEYITEAHDWVDQPSVGDDFGINIREECLVESHVVEVVEDGVVLAADDRMMEILESYGMLETADPYRREMSPPSPEEFEEGLTTGALIGAALGAKGAWHAGKKSVERNFDADEPSMLKAAGRTVKDLAQGMFDPRTYIPKKKKSDVEEGTAEGSSGEVRDLLRAIKSTKRERAEWKSRGYSTKELDQDLAGLHRELRRAEIAWSKNDRKDMAEGEQQTADVDRLLELLRKANSSINASGAYSPQGLEDLNKIYEVLRHTLMRGNMGDFEQIWSHASATVPDAFDAFADELFSAAGLPEGSTYEEFMQSLNNMQEGWNDHIPDPDNYREYLDQLLMAADIRRKEQRASASEPAPETPKPAPKQDESLCRIQELAGMPPSAMPAVTEGGMKNWIDDLYYDFKETHDLPADIDDDEYLDLVSKFLTSQGVDPNRIEDIGEAFIEMRDREAQEAPDDREFNQQGELDAGLFGDDERDDEIDESTGPMPLMSRSKLVRSIIRELGLNSYSGWIWTNKLRDDSRTVKFLTKRNTLGRAVKALTAELTKHGLQPSVDFAIRTPNASPGHPLMDDFRSVIVHLPVDSDLDEAKYQGREVPLGKPMAGDVKKSKVYVRGPKGNVVKVNFGDKTMRIKKSNPGRRKNFRARHNCDNPGPRWKARYWSCRAW